MDNERLWTPLFVLIIGVSLCTFMTGQGLNSGTSVYLSYYGGTATYAGVLATVFSLAACATRLLTGPLIDHTGRRVVMVAGAVLLLVGTLGPTFTHATAVFVVFRVLQGVGFAALSTSAATAAADVLPASRLGEGIGYFGLGQALAMSVGPAFALFLVSTEPHENLYYGTAALAALGLLCALLCRYEHRPDSLPTTSAYRRRHDMDVLGEPSKPTARANEEYCGIWRFVEKRALPGMLPLLLAAPAFGFNIFFMGLYGTSLGLENTGLYYTVTAITMVVVRLGSSRLLDRMAPIRLFTFAASCGVIAFAMLLAAGTLAAGSAACQPLFLAAGVPFGLFMGIATPLGQSVAVRNTPPERWGAATALYQMAPDIGNALAGTLWGIVNDAFGFPATLCCVIACIVGSWLVALRMFPRTAPSNAA